MGTWTPGPGPTSGNDTYSVPGLVNELVSALGGFDTLYLRNDANAALNIYSFLSFDVGTGLFSNAITDGVTLIRYRDVERVLVDGSTSADTLNLSGVSGVTFVINGGAGNDVLSGGEERDTFVFSAGIANGADTITNYLPGFDVLDLAGATAISYASNLDLDSNGIANDTRVTYTSAGGGGTITLHNVLVGDAGATITGTTDTETLDGRGGAYTMTGGLGDDRYVVDDAGDVIVEQADSNQTGSGGTGDTVYALVQNYILPAEVEHLRFIGVGDFVGTGNASINYIVGGAGNDTLDDGGSSSGAFNDTLEGGAGNDTYIVRNAGTNVYEDAGRGVDTIRTALSSYSLSVFAEIENLTFTGSGDFTGNGNSLANVITGGAGNDQLYGGSGADTLIGGGGNDLYTVYDAGDTIVELANGGTDTVRTNLASYTLAANVENLSYFAAGFNGGNLTGNALANVITGDITNEVINGGDGNDTLIGGGGRDTFDGGAGVDSVDFSSFTTAIAAYLGFGAGDQIWTRNGPNLSSGTWQGIGVIANVESVIGTAFDDLLSTNAATTNFTAGAGDDVLEIQLRNAGAPLLTLDGGANNAGGDTADFSRFHAGVWASLNYSGYEAWTRDTSNVDTGNWRAIADISNVENIVGSAYDDYLHGGAGANVISYVGGLDVIDGDAGNDTVDFSRFGSAVWAALSYSGYEGWTRDTTNLDSGNWRAIADIVNVENVTGTSYDDYLRGSATSNTLIGGAGADTLEGAGGADALNGGQGVDTASYALSGAGVTVNLSTGSASGGDAAGDTFVSIENLIGSASVDTLTGTTGANLIDGGGGADFLIGLAGDDTYLVTQGDTVTEAFGEGRDRILSTATSFTIGANIEVYQFTGAGSYAVTGGATDNTFVFGPNAGLATINGAGGSDTIDFSSFGAAVWASLGRPDVWTRDTNNLDAGSWRQIGNVSNIENLVGTLGSDYLQGNASDNTIFYNGGFDQIDGAGGANDTVDFSAFGAAIWASLSRPDVWTRDTNNVDTGTWRQIAAVTNVENLVGTSGNDYLQGGAGANTIFYTGGHDQIDGAGGVDTVDFSRFGSAVWVSLVYPTDEAWTRDTTDLNTGTWRGIADIMNVENITGSAYGDDLRGDSNANRIEGGAGNDAIMGGAGADVFVYRGDSANVINAGHDVITDFVHGVDFIELDTSLSAMAAGAALHINNAGADALVTFDGSPDLLITVAGVDLNSSDFLFT